MLRTFYFMALVAMFFVALASSAQVATSALSGVVTDKKLTLKKGIPIAVLYTPSDAKCYAVNNMDGSYTIQGMRHGLHSSLIDITEEIPPQVKTEEGILKVISLHFLELFAILLVVSFVFIIAILKGKNIKIKFSKFNMEIGDQKENED